MRGDVARTVALLSILAGGYPRARGETQKPPFEIFFLIENFFDAIILTAHGTGGGVATGSSIQRRER